MSSSAGSPRKSITVHTDGACLGNPGPGGYGAVLEFEGTRKELSGGFRLTTNNRMELLAAILALETLKEPCKVTLHSDSKYVVDAIEQGWARRWQANDWMRNKKEAAINPDLWERLLQQTERHDVTFRWVRGHAGNVENERCDRLAVEAANGDDLETDSIYESSSAYGRVQMV
ncbi:MAG: ribonuclease HI [Chloroflexi bacterium]|nr:ribonuclease HI [Chloroflexota bacterium]